jgi:hypothetical protein
MVGEMMEQIIEFPISQQDMFDGVWGDHNGYCVCYQHDIDSYGYGPYGFDTAKANRWLKKTFPPLVYWDSERQKFIDVEVPKGRGIYFFKDQSYIEKIQQELLDYERAKKSKLLRAKYKKMEDVGAELSMPAILTVSNGALFPVSFLNTLLSDQCVFFILYSLIPYTGQAIVAFDSVVHKSMKKNAEIEGIFYLVVETIDQIKPW